MSGGKQLIELLAITYRSWQEDKAPRLGAALAYYTIFSIPPLLILLIGIASLVFDTTVVQGRFLRTLEDMVGPQGAVAIHDMLANQRAENPGVMPTVIGTAMLLIGASAVFGHLKDAINTVWEIEPKPTKGKLAFLRKYVFALAMLLGTGFLLLVSLAVSTLLTALGDTIHLYLPGGEGLWSALDLLSSLTVISFLFALLYRYIPDAVVAWKDALLGGLVTSVLFNVGRYLIGFYLGRTNIGSAFGAAGSLVVLLVWVYYSSQIFFFGAEFTKTYATRYGSSIVPEPHAVPVTEEARSQQGIPRHEVSGAADPHATKGPPVR
jgi:membrane protein